MAVPGPWLVTAGHQGKGELTDVVGDHYTLVGSLAVGQFVHHAWIASGLGTLQKSQGLQDDSW